jgi:hypothetical protein
MFFVISLFVALIGALVELARIGHPLPLRILIGGVLAEILWWIVIRPIKRWLSGGGWRPYDDLPPLQPDGKPPEDWIQTGLVEEDRSIQ